jgi:hypothetical protein
LGWIYAWRTAQKLSYDEIADRLDLDLDRYPPPEPVPGRGRRAIGAWTKGAGRRLHFPLQVVPPAGYVTDPQLCCPAVIGADVVVCW